MQLEIERRKAFAKEHDIKKLGYASKTIHLQEELYAETVEELMVEKFGILKMISKE